MRKAIAVMALMCCCGATSAVAQVSFAFDSPGISIGVNVPVYPNLVRVPGYPVYYAPNLNANYFFYDGLYWVFVNGGWYASPWYNGPWQLVSDDVVPLYVLRVPVRYYREPPVFFHGWAVNAPPRWGDHWGAQWQERHRGWDSWNRAAAPAPAPLPTYQRQYAGNRYPTSVDQQRTLESQNYHYQPRDRFAQQHVQTGAPVQNAQAPRPGTSTRTNAANAERSRSETAQRAGSEPTVAHQAVPPAQRPTSPTVAQQREHRAPATEQQHAQTPRPEQRASAPRPEQRAAAPRPEQRAAAPRPEQRAAAPRPEQRAAAPRPEQRAAAPRPEQRAAAPRPEQRAAAPRPEPTAPQAHAQGRPENKGQAKAEHGNGKGNDGNANDNARAGERRNEPNG